MSVSEHNDSVSGQPLFHVLEDAGLVAHRKRARTRVYRLRAARLAVVKEWLDWFSRS